MAWSIIRNTQDHGVLYPEYGLHYKQVGQMLPNSDSVFVTLVVKVPSAMDLPKEFIKDVICEDFNTKELHSLRTASLDEDHWNHKAKLNDVEPGLFTYYVNMCTRSLDITMQAKAKVETSLSKN